VAAVAVASLVLAVGLLVAAAVERRRTTDRLRTAVRRLDPGDGPVAGSVAELLDRIEERADASATERADARGRERRLSAALAAIPQGLVIHDGDGRRTFHNDVAAEFLTARPGEALVAEAISELAATAATLEEGSPAPRRSLELFGPPRRVLELHAVPLPAEGAQRGVLVVIDDISERRRLEAVRRDFVANISHELKTPVGALGLLAETLLAEDDPVVARRLAGRLLTEADRVGRTIDDLLALSSIEAGEAGLRNAVPVHVAMAEAVERVRPAAEHCGIEIEVAEPSPRLTVLGDRRQLVSAIYNLLDNAVKYSDPGSRVELRAGTDGRWVDVAVTDRGIGIPRRDLERIFERFYRVDRARSRETGGTGLGLAIVRHVASNHAGEVRVDSQEGEGSTFTLRLPVGPGPVVVTAEAG
jgi:two-component system, OmpR family, sensor histidine kinase SenX3